MIDVTILKFLRRKEFQSNGSGHELSWKKREEREEIRARQASSTHLAENMVTKSQFEALKVDLQDNDPPDTSCASTCSEFFPITEAPEHSHRSEKSHQTSITTVAIPNVFQFKVNSLFKNLVTADSHVATAPFLFRNLSDGNC